MSHRGATSLGHAYDLNKYLLNITYNILYLFIYLYIYIYIPFYIYIEKISVLSFVLSIGIVID